MSSFTHMFGLGAILSLVIQGACSSNVFTLAESPDAGEKALALMDQEQPEEAVTVLEKALTKDPNNWTLVSILASAKTQLAGIDSTHVAIKLATQSSGSENNNSNGLLALFDVLPIAGASELALIEEALTLLASIPEADRTAAELFKISLFSTVYTTLQLRSFDADLDGSFDVNELESMSEESATAILNTLISAETAANTYKNADGSDVSADTISAIVQQIQAQPGSSNVDKIRSYFGATGPS